MIGHAPNGRWWCIRRRPAKSVAELIALCQGPNPGKVNYGSAGVGTVGHVSRRICSPTRPGSSSCTFPTRAPGRCMADLLGGHIPMAFAQRSRRRTASVASGKLRGAGGRRAPSGRAWCRTCRPSRSPASRLRGRAVLRAGRAGRHAAADHRPAEQGAARSARHRRGAEAAANDGAEAMPSVAGGICRRHRPRGEALGRRWSRRRPGAK